MTDALAQVDDYYFGEWDGGTLYPGGHGYWRACDDANLLRYYFRRFAGVLQIAKPRLSTKRRGKQGSWRVVDRALWDALPQWLRRALTAHGMPIPPPRACAQEYDL